MAPSVGTIYNIIVDEDWLLMIICLRNRNIYYSLTFDFNRAEIAIKKDITADFLTIVQDVEKVSFYFIRIRDSCNLKSRLNWLFFVLRYAKKYNTSTGIGKGRIGFPH